jgi:hypothetical protein
MCMAQNGQIGALHVKLGLDSAQFEQGIKKTQASLKGLNFAGLSGAVVGAAAVAGLTTAFIALRKSMQIGDDIADTAKRLAVSTDALQEYRYAVHQLGGDFEDADKALEGFSKAFGLARSNFSKRATKPFEALGLDPKAFASTEEAFQAVIEKISQLSSTAEQAAIADKLGIGSMLPAIRDGGAAIDDLRKKAHDLGFVIGSDVVDELGTANDKFEDMQKILDAQLATAMVNLAPLILTVAEKLAQGAMAANAFASRIGDLVDRINGSGFGKALGKLGQLSGYLSPFGIAGKMIGQAGGALAKADKAKPAAAAKPPPPPGTGSLLDLSGGGGKGPRDRSADAIAAAEQDELRARTQLTSNIEELTKLRLTEIDAELADANRRAREDAAEGAISQAALKTVVAANERVAAMQRQAAELDMAERASREEFEYRSELNRYLDATSELQADAASTAVERNRIEALALAGQQKVERERLAADQEAERAREAGNESARAAVKAAQDDLHAAERAAQAREGLARVLEEQETRARSVLDLQVELLGGYADLANSSYERARIELEILKLQQAEERQRLEIVANSTDLNKYSAAEVEEARRRLAVLPQLHANQLKLVEAGNTLLDAFATLAGAVEGMVSAFKRGDIGAGISGLGATLQQIAGLTSGRGGGISGAAGNAGGLLGGIGAIGGLFGGGASAAGGAAVLAGATAELGAAGAAAGGLAGSLGAVGAALGPIGAIVGVLGVLSSLLGGKPSNRGAGFDLVSGAISGKSRDKDTEAAAVGTGKIILQMQAALKKLGATLSTTVNGLVIGARDLTQIYLSDGRTLTSAIGDAGAATETALRAVLEAAQFADEAQRELVKSMLASGETALDVIDALQAAAEEALAKAEDIAAKRRDLEIRYLELSGDAVGALTARRKDEIAALDASLHGLQLAIYAAEDLASLGALVSEARDREASAIQATIDKFKAFADSLRDFRDSLKLDALQQASSQTRRDALFRELQNVASLAAQGDEGAQSRFQSVAEAFLGASKDSAATLTEVKRDQALVARLTSDALDAALSQVNIGEAQLDSLNRTVDALLGIDTKVQSLNDLLKQYLAAKAGVPKGDFVQAAVVALAGQGSQAAVNFSAAGYLAANKDLAKYAEANGVDPLSFAEDHYRKTGQYEIAAGYRKPGFATGGSFQVGGTGGIDSQYMSLWASPGEYGMISKEDPLKTLDAATQVQLGQTQLLRRAVRVLERLEVDGLYARGADPDSPVLTEAA